MTTQHYSHTNHSNKYQLVADSHVVLSEHDTFADAENALHALPHIDDTEWADIWIVKPGDTKTGDYQPGLTPEQIHGITNSQTWFPEVQ